MAQVRSRTAVTGSPELPLAHGRASDRAENGYPQRKTKGSILTKMFRKLHIFLYFNLPLWYNKGRLKLLLGGEFMAAADRKITYTAAEVAELIRPLTQSVEALQKENAELKRKLEHLNEILANAQRAREPVSVSPARKTAMFCTTRPAFSMRRKRSKPPKRRSRLRIPF